MNLLEDIEQETQIVKRDPFDPIPLTRLFDSFVEQIAIMEIEARGIQVTDDESYMDANEKANQAGKILKTIENKRVEVKFPYLKVTSAIDGFCKPLKDRLEAIRKIINDNKIRPYMLEKDRQRREAERLAREEAARIQRELEEKARKEREEAAEIARQIAEAAGRSKEEAAMEARTAAAEVEMPPVVVQETVPAETKVSTESGTTVLKKEWAWEITDFKALPAEAFEARKAEVVKALAPYFNAQVKAGIRNIPGVRIYQEAKIQNRMKY